MRHLGERLIGFGAAILLLSANAVLAQAQKEPVRIAVDLRDSPRHVFHAKLKFPVKPGPLTLVYPKWIQGEHAPTGPIVNLTGLKMLAGGKEVVWRRDEVDMYAFHLDVPQGAEMLEVSLEYLSAPPESSGSHDRSDATAKIAVLNWYLVTLYPQGIKTDDLTYEASLQLPVGWKYGTALPVAKETPEEIAFAPATLTNGTRSRSITSCAASRIAGGAGASGRSRRKPAIRRGTSTSGRTSCSAIASPSSPGA